MTLPDLVLTGWDEIKAHKLRSFLSFFAIAIGIATFFYTLSILSQRYSTIDKAVEIGGKGRISTSTENAISLTQYKDFLYLLPKGSSLSLTTDWGWNEIFYKSRLVNNLSFKGVLPTWKDVDFAYKLEGRFINWQDVQNHHRIGVIMSFPREKKKRNFPVYTAISDDGIPPIDFQELTYRNNLLNQNLQVGNEQITIVGILHVPPIEQDPRFSRYRDPTPLLLLPYTTWQDLQFSFRDNFSTDIRIVTGKESLANSAAAQTISFLRSQFGKEEKPKIKFFRDDVRENTKAAYQDLKNMLLLGFIAMIAGGIGIMNVTLAVIYSRTKEIGIRRALGATRKDILFQFLIEAMLLGLCGSIAGMFLGYCVLLYIAQNVFQMTFSWWVVVLSIFIGLSTSFLFALYPAWQAAKLKPVDALKYE